MRRIDRPFEILNDEDVVVRGNFVAFKQNLWQPTQQDFIELWLAREVIWFCGTFKDDDAVSKFCMPIIRKVQKKGGYRGAAEIRIGKHNCYLIARKASPDEGGDTSAYREAVSLQKLTLSVKCAE